MINRTVNWLDVPLERKLNKVDLDTLFDSLRAAFAVEFQRGAADARQRAISAIEGRPSTRAAARGRKGGKQRAPRGSARALVQRVIKEGGSRGASAPEIQAAAKSPTERSVSMSAIRFELYRGKKSKLYIGKSGRWTIRAGGKGTA